MVRDKRGQLVTLSASQAPKWGSTGNLCYPSCSPCGVRMCCVCIWMHHIGMWATAKVKFCSLAVYFRDSGLPACLATCQGAGVGLSNFLWGDLEFLILPLPPNLTETSKVILKLISLKNFLEIPWLLFQFSSHPVFNNPEGEFKKLADYRVLNKGGWGNCPLGTDGRCAGPTYLHNLFLIKRESYGWDVLTCLQKLHIENPSEILWEGLMVVL